MSVVVQELGYAQYPYATENYASGIVDSADGLQFRAVNEGGARTLGAQWQQRIDVAAFAGLQADVRNTQDAARGAQFEVVNANLANTGLQFRGVNDGGLLAAAVQFLGASVDNDRASGVQWEQRNDVSRAAGVQFAGANDGGLRASGFEFRAARGWTHYQCSDGYATQPYAVLPYLVPSICATGGIQFAARNEVAVATGVQWQQRIDASRVVGMQWQQRIDKDEPTGFQFDAVQALSTGFQFRVVIYNTTNLRVLYQFPSRGTSGTNWTADTTASSSTNAFSANNLNTDIVEQIWRSGTTTNAILTCDTQVNQGVFVDTLAILNHNFGGGADIRLEKSTNGIAWILEAVLPPERENIYYIAPSLPLQAYRYWRIVIADGSASFFQVGTIVFGSSVILQGECFTDTVRFGRRQFADKVFTEGHTNVANDRGKKRFLGLDFQSLNFGLANFRQLREVFDATGTILKALWIPTPQTPSRFAVFGKLEEIPEETHNTKGDDYVSLSVKVDESL